MTSALETIGAVILAVLGFLLVAALWLAGLAIPVVVVVLVLRWMNVL